MIGYYKIADRLVRIESLYSGIHKYCHGYEASSAETEASVDIDVKISPSDIEREKKGNNEYSDAYWELLAVHRKLSTAMLDFDTFLFHGSCVAVDGEAFLFTAPSGTGKSTHARLWREYLGEKVIMVNDDKPFIRVDDTGVFVYGTPFNGKHRLGTDICVPLKAVCLLSRGETNEISRVPQKDAYPYLIKQTYRPETAEQLAKTMALLDRLTFSVELYTLSCNMDVDAARVAYEGMHGK